MKSLRLSIYQHLSIIIACIVIFASPITFYSTPTVEADLSGPYFIRGYINNSTAADIPSGVTVTVTNTNNSNSDTTTTNSNSAYQINVGKDTGFDCSDGHQIVVNCSYNSEVGENATNIDVSATFAWCNLTGDNKLEAENLSIDIKPTSWDAGTTSWGSSYNTTDTYFNLTNEGNVKINVKIQGENFTWDGNKWNLTNTTALNNYSIAYKKSGEGSWTNITIANTSFITNLQHNSSYFSYTYWQLFGFNLSTPTSSVPAPSGEQQLNVTFWSIKA